LRVSKVLGLALGIIAAIGGFVDIGDLVFNVAAGATFGYQLLWVIVVGLIGIIVYSEMCGRVAAVSGRAVFDAIRERVGFKGAVVALVSSEVVNLMTLAAELGGVAIALQLLSGLPYRWLIVFAVVAFAVVIWVTSFEWIERIFGFGGLCMLVFAVVAVKLGPDWGKVGAGFVPHISHTNSVLYAYFVVGILGTAMTPYEVYFYSSGGIEDQWSPKDLGLNRANAILGYGLGGTLSFALMITGGALFLSQRDLTAAFGHCRARRGAAPGAGRPPARARRDPVRGRSGLDRHRLRGRVQPCAVLRLGVGPLPPPAWGATVRPHLARSARARTRDPHDRRRPGAADGIRSSLFSGRAAADLCADPARRERQGVHGPPRQRPDRKRTRVNLSRGDHDRCLGSDPVDDPDERGSELSGKEIDIGLHVLDHQLLDKDGRRCGNVDDLAIEGGVGEVPEVSRDPLRPRLLGAARGHNRQDRGAGSGAAEKCLSPGVRCARSTRRSS